MGNAKVKAQVALEFITAFICTILLLVLTARLFVWFGSTIVNRQRAYEQTRTAAGDGATTSSKIDFYPPSKLDLFGKMEELPK